MKLDELKDLQDLKDFVMKNRAVDTLKIGQTDQMNDFTKSEDLLELERKQLVCLITLVEIVDQKHKQVINVLISTTLFTWVLMLITFITVILN
jgi:hypothetical protein